MSIVTEGYWEGKFQKESSGKTFEVWNPSTGEKIADVTDCGAAETRRALDSAHKAFQTWSKTTPKQRSTLMMKLSDGLKTNQERIATILAKENVSVLNKCI